MANYLELGDAARLYDNVMSLWQHYQSVLPLEIHTVCYEDLVAGFDETLQPLLMFLGVEWQAGIRDYAKTAGSRSVVNTPSYNQVTQKLYSRASGRWQKYREPMQPVLPLLLPWAQRFGYEDNEPSL